MIGIIFFWLDYIICGLALYSFVFCRYKKERVEGTYYWEKKFTRINERVKTPLWQVLILILLYIIPMLNLTIIAPFMMIHYTDEHNYYYKSFLTKEI